MAYSFRIPFYAFKLHLKPGEHLLIPLAEKEAVRFNQPLHLVARRYAEALQREVFNKGDLREILDEYRPGNFIKAPLRVPFPASKDQFSYPDIELEFDFYYNALPHGIWGVVPVLGIEAFSGELNNLSRRLREAVQLDFARNRRLQAVQDIVSTIWFESVELLQQEIEIQAPSPREVDERLESQEENWLPKLAHPLRLDRRVTFGREAELEQLERALKNNFSRNILLVGPSGVGKTALIWEISRQMKKRGIEGQIWETTAATLIKELTRETGWQDNLAKLCKELASSEHLLFIRNLMELFEVGKYEGNNMSMADYMRTYLSRGEMALISECTEEEMARIELKTPHYLSLFQVIRIAEPKTDLEDIILKKVQSVAHTQKITLTDEAIREVIRLNQRFLPYAGMPGKPIRFLESMLLNKRSVKSDKKKKREILKINRSEVIRHFCEESGMPRFMIDPEIPIDIRSVKDRFNRIIFGQKKAVDSVVDLLAGIKTALTRTGKPIASFLFVGPTGVGKTELAKVLAQFMFGSRNRLTRFDMSEFSTPFSVMRLIGTSYGAEGLLTSVIRREPFTVLLFDEIEKAHSNFYELLLQLLSEGRLTDDQGKLVNFCSTIIIMTSNIGSDSSRGQRISWSSDREPVADHYIQAVRNHFRPELFNRIDQILPFEPLAPRTVSFIVRREIEQFRQREGIQFRRIQLEIEDDVYRYLAEKGYDEKYGARQLQRVIREQLIVPVAKALNAEDPDDQLVATARMQDGTPAITMQVDELGLELLIEELDKIRNTDHSSRLRRQIHALREGAFYVQLLNELQILERQKKQQKKEFWQDRSRAMKYSYYLKTKQEVEKLSHEIEAIEMELGMNTLGLRPFRPAITERLDSWEQQFFDLKVEIYRRLYPKTDRCCLGIYGQNLEAIVTFYLELFDLKDFDFNLNAVWFRDSHYTETLRNRSKPKGGGSAPEDSLYIKKQVDMSSWPEVTPTASGDLLQGVEFSLSGAAVFLYLWEESGIQRWEWKKNEPRLFSVVVQNEKPDTPDKIHRKEFYQRESPRRILETERIRDTMYNIDSELDIADLAGFFKEILDTRFKGKINMEVS